MEENTQTDVIQEAVVEPNQPETSNDQPEVAIKTEEPSAGSKEYNWRQMEDTNKQLQKQVWELEQKDQQAQEKIQLEKEELKLEKDDLITYGQVDELVEKRAETKARAIFQEEFKKAERAKQPLAAKQKYSDFEKVVTNENINKLEKEDPELARLIALSNDPFDRTYKEIRRSDFFKSTQMNKESDEKIAENSQKPVSSNSFGKQRPLSYANDFAKGHTSLNEEMQKYRGGSL